MSPSEERVYKFIVKHPGCTYRDLEAFTESAHRNIVFWKNNLVDKRYIKEKVTFPPGVPVLKRFYPRKV